MSKFSHIYIEEGATAYPVTQHVLSRFPRSIRVAIRHYKDVFNRPHQNFRRQKASPKLILAVKQEPFLYPGPEVCEDFGHPNFYYTSPVLNCIYDCDYCYLQGLYPSANIVIFVNIEDFFKAVDRKLESGPLYLCPSYDTDLLALEGIVPYASRWIEFAATRQDLVIELRTKSANYSAIAHLKPAEQVILAWSLSPGEVARRYERLAPPLKTRLTAIKAALQDGWQVRLCFEPLLKVYSWQHVYNEFLDEVFSILPAEKIFDANIGVFRMSKEHFKRISRMRNDTDVFAFPMVCCEGEVVTYEDEKELRDFFYQGLKRYLPEGKIYG
ncbi:spore photoproduct lyase [Caldicoprobacter guelmensis]|uniref:SPL family radical SAM protein n=1 Tax=Caldicoprobacter guelmensis TaxID=1170224 RepID=UPI00195DFD2E|nr:radical SAM protein [Caldicoprobacter guelmensis]MBM7582596.1 spore photoproduct lyase [Caldicoprobacter guelmensis]